MTWPKKCGRYWKIKNKRGNNRFDLFWQGNLDGARPSEIQPAHEKPLGASAAQVPMLDPIKLAALIFLVTLWLSHAGQTMSGSSPANTSFSNSLEQVLHWYSYIGIQHLPGFETIIKIGKIFVSQVTS
jgi:hypothetical protein